MEQIKSGDIEMVDDRIDDCICSTNPETSMFESVPAPDFIKKYSLNTEQIRIFRIIHSHMERTFANRDNAGQNQAKLEQLLMYIGSSSQ